MVLPGGPGGRVRRRQHIFGLTLMWGWAHFFDRSSGWSGGVLSHCFSRRPGVIRGRAAQILGEKEPQAVVHWGLLGLVRLP